MSFVAVPFNVSPVGDRMHVVEWELNPTNETDVFLGDFYEAENSELISISAFSNEGILCKLYHTNHSVLSGAVGEFAFSTDISETISMPPNLPPSKRFYAPSAEGVVGLSRVALLFKEV